MLDAQRSCWKVDADFCRMPSYHAGCPTVALESPPWSMPSYHAGCPVIALEVGSSLIFNFIGIWSRILNKNSTGAGQRIPRQNFANGFLSGICYTPKQNSIGAGQIRRIWSRILNKNSTGAGQRIPKQNSIGADQIHRIWSKKQYSNAQTNDFFVL